MGKPAPANRLHDELFADAERYEREKVPRMFEPAARLLVKHVPLQPDARVLDVACGTGIVARIIAGQPGFRGRVTGLDIDANMLAVAHAAAAAESLSIEWQEGDATYLPFDSETFDLVLCQQGIQYFPDKDAALRSMQRALVPGGRVAILVAASITAEDQPRKWAEMEALRRHVSNEAAEKERHPGYFQGGANRLKRLINEAGFRDVTVQTVLEPWGPTGTLEQLIPEAEYLELAPDKRTAVVKEIRQAMRPYDNGSETRLPGGFYIAIGMK